MEIKKCRALMVIAILFTFFLAMCEFPFGSDTGGKPTPSQYIRPSVTYNSLPGYNEPATLTFTIEFVGEENAMPVRDATGDTLRWLLLFFRADEWLEGMNEVTNSSWYWYDSVYVGKEMSFAPRYQVTRSNYDGYSDVQLRYRMDPTSITRDSIDKILTPDTVHTDETIYNTYSANEWNFGFNHISGDTTTGF